MPVYNAERFVAEALIEYSCADTWGLRVPDRRRRLNRRLVSRPNKGLVPSLNELVYVARGEFLARMDADDIGMPERFEKQVGYLRAHPECAVVGCRVWEIDADGDTVTEWPTLSDHTEIDAFHFRLMGPALLHPSIVMRRDAVLAIGGYRQ
jgi:glycosyltransferase involved in cell wall biosynthesis